jgi:hypothetical protein
MKQLKHKNVIIRPGADSVYINRLSVPNSAQTHAVSLGTLFFCCGDVVCLIWQCLRRRSRSHCVLVASGNAQLSPRGIPLSVLTTISNCQARSNGVGRSPYTAGSVYSDTTACLSTEAKRSGGARTTAPFLPCLVYPSPRIKVLSAWEDVCCVSVDSCGLVKVSTNQLDYHSGPLFLHLQDELVDGNQTR